MTVRVTNVEDTTSVDTQPSKKRTSLINGKMTLYRGIGVFKPWLVEEGLKYER